MTGLVHPAKAAPSSEHSKVAPIAGEENVKAAVVCFDWAGGAESIVVMSTTVSVSVSAPLQLPAASRARIPIV